jgi:hypothetical protein
MASHLQQHRQQRKPGQPASTNTVGQVNVSMLYIGIGWLHGALSG